MELGERIKSYEKLYDARMINRLPVIIRLDGKGFSKWTKKIQANKPFDEDLSAVMAEAMRTIAVRLDGCLFGYTQSDEVTFVLRNDRTFNTTPLFGNRIQKICSIVSSMFSVKFANLSDYDYPAYFDCRAFAVPSVQEAVNCLVWRQLDCIKNSISTLCYYELSEKYGRKTARKMMHKLNQDQREQLLSDEVGIQWAEDCPERFKFGIGCLKRSFVKTTDEGTFERSYWTTDDGLPEFTKDQSYFNKVLRFPDEQL